MLVGLRRKLNALTASPVLSINGIPVNQVSKQKISRCTHWYKPYLGQSYWEVGWKNCLWYRSYQTGQAICSPSITESYLQILDSAAFRLLQCCLGKLWQLNLHTQRDIHKVLMVFKSLNGLTPDYLRSKFIALSNNTSCTFRDSVNKLTLFLNSKEMVSFRAKTWYLHMWKYYLLLWLHSKPRLSHKKLLKWNGLVFHWCLYNK